MIKIHEPKYKVDGITKYIENHQFTFDNTFNEEEVVRSLHRLETTSTNSSSNPLSRLCSTTESSLASPTGRQGLERHTP